MREEVEKSRNINAKSGEMEKCGDFQAILGEKGGFRDWVLCVCRLRSGYFLVSGQHSGLPPACSQQREIIFPLYSSTIVLLDQYFTSFGIIVAFIWKLVLDLQCISSSNNPVIFYRRSYILSIHFSCKNKCAECD